MIRIDCRVAKEEGSTEDTDGEEVEDEHEHALDDGDDEASVNDKL
jgi:hypothetical protein